MNFPRDQLKLLKEFGAGDFGKVHMHISYAGLLPLSLLHYLKIYLYWCDSHVSFILSSRANHHRSTKLKLRRSSLDRRKLLSW